MHLGAEQWFSAVRTSEIAVMRPATRRAVGTCALLAASACAREADPGAGAARPTDGEPITISRARSEDLTGDDRAERLLLTARGPRIDSLDVRLEIRSPEDSLLYASAWNSLFYFQYDDRSAMTDSAADAKVRGHLDRVLASEAFRVGARGVVGDTARLSMMRDAIRYDIATLLWRAQNRLGPGDPLPPEAHDPINVLARGVSASRIENILREVDARKSFQFFAGGEVTYAIAWSDQEKRFVTIFSCC